MCRKSLPDTNAKLVTTVHTKNGEETRPIENLARLVNYRGIPECVRDPKLRPGEELFRTLDGDVIVVEATQECRSFVTAVSYEWDAYQVKRTAVYSDGRTVVEYVHNMPAKEEIQKEHEMYNQLSRSCT